MTATAWSYDIIDFVAVHDDSDGLFKSSTKWDFGMVWCKNFNLIGIIRVPILRYHDIYSAAKRKTLTIKWEATAVLT